jgi:hypothetical protein
MIHAFLPIARETLHQAMPSVIVVRRLPCIEFVSLIGDDDVRRAAINADYIAATIFLP